MLQLQRRKKRAHNFDYGTLLYESRLPKDKILVRLYRHGNQETYLLPLNSHFAPLQRLPTLVDFPHHTDYLHLRISLVPLSPSTLETIRQTARETVHVPAQRQLAPDAPVLVVRPNQRDGAIGLGLLQLEVFLRDV